MKTQNRHAISEEEVLLHFAVEQQHDAATLSRYLRRYPRHKAALKAIYATLIREGVTLRFHFEDDGQDFLSWDVKAHDGTVVGCEPFQASIWCKCRVVSPFQYKAGHRLAIILPTGERRRLQHDIERIEVVKKGGAS